MNNREFLNNPFSRIIQKDVFRDLGEQVLINFHQKVSRQIFIIKQINTY